MSDFFNQLIEATAEQQQHLLSIPFVRHGLQGELSLDSYLAFLGQAYHHVKHTTPLLMACGSRIPGAMEWLRDAMASYIAEELGHQEWILNDITACGGDAQRVRDAVPGPAAELMCAYAYHVVERVNPVGLLGMVLALEGTSVRVASEAAVNLERNLSLPGRAFSYLSSHGTLDVSHMEFYATLVNRLDTQHDRDCVIHCAKRFFTLYGNVFEELPLSLNEHALAA